MTPRKECAAGDKDGICWVPISQYPNNSERSHAGRGHYLEIGERANYDLLVNHKVTRVVYSGENNHMESVSKVEIHSLTEGTVLTVTAKLEVVCIEAFNLEIQAAFFLNLPFHPLYLRLN